MNNNDLLFTNKFVSILDTRDIPESSKKNFSKFIENSNEFKYKSQVKPKEKEFETQKIQRKTIVAIDSRDRDINKYPFQSDISIFLGKTFYNVKQIKLVSTEIPNSDQVITELPIEIKNNLISWQNKEDSDLNIYTNKSFNTNEINTIDIIVENHGFEINKKIEIQLFNSKLDTDINVSGIIDGKKEATVLDANTIRILFRNGIQPGTTSVYLGYPMYSINIKPGNYTASTLASEIALSMNSVKRRNGTGQFHYFEVTVNLDTDIYNIDSVITSNLKNNPIRTTSSSNIITVNAPGHGFKTGDRVKMIGVKNTAGIPASVLKGDFIVSVLDFNTFTYEITTKAIDTVDGGGNVCQIGRDAPFRLLFKSQNTRIQFNTGYPDEDSAELIKASNPITTKSLSVINAEIINNNYIRITTNVPHGLFESTKIQISNISTTNPVVITTSVPHGLELPRRVTLRNTTRLDGNFFATPTGPTTFILLGQKINQQVNSGELIYGGDRITISGLRTVPTISGNTFFFNELNFSPTQFDIMFLANIIDTTSISNSRINTSQITINHPSHNFNTISSIQGIDSVFSNCKTFLPFNLSGSIVENVETIEGAPGSVDILLFKHGLFTSDFITIKNSTSNPVVNGTFAIQVVDENIIRINFVFDTFISGTATIISGDKVNITSSNSFPRIDGEFSIHNKIPITGISSGTVTSIITVQTTHNWSVGDVINISESDLLNGDFIIQSIINSTMFSIIIQEDITTPGVSGIAVNKSRFKIQTNSSISTPGTFALIGKNNKISFYRIEPDRLKGDNIGGIMLSELNGIERPILRLIDVDNYIIRIEDSYATSSVSAGGNSVFASSFNQGMRTIQSNTVDGNKTGKLFRAISLQGIDYMFLVSPGLDSVFNTSGISNVFAKILLNEAPGNMCFNSFISVPKEFDYPISKLDTLTLQFKTRDNYLFNFNDINYSLSLEITELVDQLQNAFLSSRSGTTEFTGTVRDSKKENEIENYELQSTNKFGSLDTASVSGVGTIRSEGGRSSGAKM